MCTEAFHAVHSGILPLALSQQTHMLRGTQLPAGLGAPGGAVGPFTPHHYRLNALYFTCLSVCLPGSPPPPPPDCGLSAGVKCFFLVLQGLARAQRMLLLEWRMSREHVVLGKPTAHWASMGCPRPQPRNTAALVTNACPRPSTPWLKKQLHAEASSSSGQGCSLATLFLLSHQRPLILSTDILACFSCGVSPTRPWAPGGQGLFQGWHRPSCVLLLGLPTGVWLLQGHVLPPCQHRRLQLGGVWGLQQHTEVPQPPPVPGA